MTKETTKTPPVRFAEFTGNWPNESLGTIIIRYRLGGNYTNSESESKFPLIKMGNLDRGVIRVGKMDFIPENEVIDDADRARYGDLFFNTRNTLELVGKVAIWRDELPVAYYNSNIMRLDCPDNFFMNYRLNSWDGLKALRRIATGTTSVAAIYTRDLLKVRLSVPSLPEQQKIAAFLSAVDERIGQLVRKKELLLKYKKGVMQQIFSQKIRFKAPNGNPFPDWEEKRLSEVSTVVTRTAKEPDGIPVMTISGRRGFLSQEERFSRVIAGESLESYIALEKGEMAYNRGNSKSAMYGSVNVMRHEKALVPFVYHCFRLSQGYDPIFFEYASWSDDLNRQLRRIITSTARGNGLLNISKGDFFSVKLRFPSIDEQRVIADFLSSIDARIESVGQQIEKTKTFKKGLLQQMFV